MFLSVSRKYILVSFICLFSIFSLANRAEEENDLVKAGSKGAVKEVYRERIEFDHENDTLKTIPESRIQYNSTGFIILELLYKDTGEVYRKTEYIYDSKDRIINKKTYNDDRLSAEYTITYREDGSRLEDTYTRDDTAGTIYLYKSAEYSASGELLELKQYRAKDLLDFHLDTTRADTGETIIHVKYYDTGLVTETHIMHYNAHGLLIEKKISNSWNIKTLSISYNNYQEIKQVTFISSRDPGTPLNWEYTYNNQQELVRIDKYNPDRKIMSRRSFTYKNKRLHKEECINYDKEEKPLYSWSYSYDQKNNIIKEEYHHLVQNFSYTRYREMTDTYSSEYLYNNEFYFLSGFERSKYDDGRDALNITYGEGKTITGKTEYIYQHELLTEYIAWDSYSAQTKTTLYEYNHLKDMTTWEVYREGNILLARENYDLEYDKAGNWIRKTLFRTDNTREIYDRKETVYIREITYYEE